MSSQRARKSILQIFSTFQCTFASLNLKQVHKQNLRRTETEESWTCEQRLKSGMWKAVSAVTPIAREIFARFLCRISAFLSFLCKMATESPVQENSTVTPSPPPVAPPQPAQEPGRFFKNLLFKQRRTAQIPLSTCLDANFHNAQNPIEPNSSFVPNRLL